VKRALLALVLVLAGCGTATPPSAGDGPPAAPPSSPPSSAPASPEDVGPTFADLTEGSTKSVVKMYSFDIDDQAAVVEPIIFMETPDFCKAFKLKKSDPRCGEETGGWQSEESHNKVTVPVADEPKFFDWQDENGEVKIDSAESGGTFPIKPGTFARKVKEEPGVFVAVTTEAGEIVRAALVYTS